MHRRGAPGGAKTLGRSQPIFAAEARRPPRASRWCTGRAGGAAGRWPAPGSATGTA